MITLRDDRTILHYGTPSIFSFIYFLSIWFFFHIHTRTYIQMAQNCILKEIRKLFFQSISSIVSRSEVIVISESISNCTDNGEVALSVVNWKNKRSCKNIFEALQKQKKFESMNAVFFSKIWLLKIKCKIFDHASFYNLKMTLRNI